MSEVRERPDAHTQSCPVERLDLPTLFALRAERTPDALALIDGDTALTYRQLHSAAWDFAGHLAGHGVRRGDIVALLTRRSARTVVAQLGLWWAGAVCVPLDPAHPRARTEAMLADAGAVLTVGDEDLLAANDGIGRVLALPPAPTPLGDAGTDADEGTDAGAASAAVGPHSGPGPDAAAFLMFTSGSTGRPKGVAVRHGAVAELVTDPAYLTVTARDRVLLHSPATFDASTFEVWVALANGAAVVVCPADRPTFEDLVQEVERHGVTVAFFTTALFHQLAARRSRVFALLRTVIVGGEALSAQHARSVLRPFPWLELVNGYGPTETTTFATAHRVTDADCEGPVPIGRPVAGATAHVLDESGEPVPAGTKGELWVGGSRLALGYHGQPGLTAERFVAHPALGRVYRTGDLVSTRTDGALDYHGRTDDQVKVRGHRIEPGEIEHVLRNLPEVDDAAVTVRRPTPDDARLAAFVVGAAGAAPDPEDLRTRLTALLPAHLVPDELTVLERLPLTSTGKVDRRALAALDPAAVPAPAAGAGDGAHETAAGEPAALTPLQQAVAEVWARSLECEVTSADADFLALGGHSLLALVVTDDLREDLGVEVSLADFFATPTVAGHAALVERALLSAHADLPHLPAAHPDVPEHSDVR
ncbi:amino acid adenylation domain-containing protein [Streptomyces sp. NPDC004111]|uniref:amino acid adenylation domain-containing protein n=1 Tax=Streptomyces sp. NPDC004111 TaxID=3364690 RepID=UPI003691FB29